jgi:hypothetical protein
MWRETEKCISAHLIICTGVSTPKQYPTLTQRVSAPLRVVGNNRWQMLPQGYSKDSRYVYYGKSIVEGADPHTFVVTGESTSRAEDNNYRYNMGKRIPSQGN